MTEQIDWRIVCTGLACLTGYGVYAVSQGIDGQLMNVVIGIIALTIGAAAIPLNKFIKHK